MTNFFDNFDSIFQEDEYYEHEGECCEVKNTISKDYLTVRIKVKESIRDVFKTYSKIRYFVNESFTNSCHLLSNLKYVNFRDKKINIDGIVGHTFGMTKNAIIAYLENDELQYIFENYDFVENCLVNSYESYLDGFIDYKDNVPYLNIRTDNLEKCHKYIEYVTGTIGEIVAVTFKDHSGIHKVDFEHDSYGIRFMIEDQKYEIVYRDVYKKYNIKSEIHLNNLNLNLYEKIKQALGYCFSNSEDINNDKMLLEEFLNIASFDPDIVSLFLSEYEVLGELIVSMNNPEYLGLLDAVDEDTKKAIEIHADCAKRFGESDKTFDYFNIDRVNDIKFNDGVMYLDYITKSIDYIQLKEFNDHICKINNPDKTKISINEI